MTHQFDDARLEVEYLRRGRRALEGLDQWQLGGNVFERVRTAVAKDFPQTPQYGASRSAGHQGNTDYLFERREIPGRVP